MWPYTYNFNYYSGDTYPLVLYPKNDDGTQYDLSDKTSLFTVATERGNPDAVIFSASPQLSASPSRLLCTIEPESGALLTGASYVYDIEIRQGEEVYTLLTGSITTQQNVISN
jgi:hypothetical protein